MTASAPGLSLRERDRRIDLACEVMAELDCQALLVPPGPRGNPSDGYFTHNVPNSIALVTDAGELIGFHRSPGLVGALMQTDRRGEDQWIGDWRFGPFSEQLVAALKHLGLATARIGVVGLERATPLHPYGWTIHGLWQQITGKLPEADFVEAWDQFAIRWLTKSDEELACFRYASELAERACQAMVDAAAVGATEGDLAAALHDAVLRPGGELPYFILHSGKDNLSWGFPYWLYRAVEPRKLESGDVVLSEIFPTWGGIESQAQICIGVGELHDDFHRAAAVAREAYDAGVAALQPGRTFGEVASDMTSPVVNAGAWHLTPQIHSLTPLTLIGPVLQGDLDAEYAARMPERPARIQSSALLNNDTVIREGMTFQLETNAVYGQHRVNIGGNAIVTSTGCEALNELPTRMHLV